MILPELTRTTPDKLLPALQSGTAKLADDDKREGREHSLAASLSYRLDALDPAIRKHLGVLALFQGFVDADVLAMMGKAKGSPKLIHGLQRDDWLTVLDPSTEVGLLRKIIPGVYTIHPAVPWFLHDMMAEAFPGDESGALINAYCEAYAAYGYYLTGLFETNAEVAMTLLRLEEGNLMHALWLSVERELWEYVQDVLYGIRTLLTTQGRWVEWERLVSDLEAMTQAEDGEPLPGREELWLALLGHRGELAESRREFEMAEALHMRLKEHFERAGDDRNLAATLHQLGTVAQQRRQLDEAEGWYRRSLEIEERIGEVYGQAATLHQLGRIAQERRQFDEAEAWCRRSLEIEERIGNERGQAQTLHELGCVAQARGQLDEAEGRYRRSLEIKERIGDRNGQATTLHNLGIVAQKRGQFDEAEGWYRRSLEIEERIGDQHGQAETLALLGVLAIQREQLQEAIDFLERAESLFVKMNDPYHLEMTRGNLQRVREAMKGE